MTYDPADLTPDASNVSEAAVEPQHIRRLLVIAVLIGLMLVGCLGQIAWLAITGWSQ